MDWKKVRETQSASGAGRPTLPAGTHRVKISSVLVRKKDGDLVTTKEGEPQIVVTLSNDSGEVAYFAPLEGPQIWKFESLIAAVCSDSELDQMTASGLSPRNFLADAICRVYLLGRRLILVGKTTAAIGRDGRPMVNWYANPLPNDGVVDHGPTEQRDPDVPF